MPSATTPHVCSIPLHLLPAQFLADTSDLWRKIRYVSSYAGLSFAQLFPASMLHSLLVSLVCRRHLLLLMFLASLCHMCMGVQCRVGACCP